MPGGFSNPIVAGLQLLIQAIRSPNYVAGVQGWTINKDGSAEFNNLTIRGTFYGTDYVLDANGLRFYSGTPAAGNLILSLAPAAGTDPFGNPYSQGLTAGAAGSVLQIILGITAGSPVLFFLSAISTALNNAALQLLVTNPGTTAAHDTLVIKSSQDDAHVDYVAINLNGNSNDGTTATTSMNNAYVDTGGAPHFYYQLSAAGLALVGSLAAAQPGTSPAAAETWHTASLAANWTTGGSDQAPRYRLEGIGAGVVRLDGTAYTSAAVASGATIFTLPSGYRPSTDRRRYAGVTNASGYTVPGGTLVNIATTGVVTIGVAAGAANEQVVLDNITFPID